IAEPRLLVVVAIATPWLAAPAIAIWRERARVLSLLAATVSVFACALLLETAATGASLYPALMLLFSCLALGATLVLPRRDCGPAGACGILFILGSTLLAYSADNLLTLFAAWVLSAIPFFFPRWCQAQSWRPRAALLFSAVALGLAIVLIVASGNVISIDALKGRSPGGNAAFALLVAAVVLRKGILPAHAWVADAAEGGSILPTALLFNGHFG